MTFSISPVGFDPPRSWGTSWASLYFVVNDSVFSFIRKLSVLVAHHVCLFGPMDCSPPGSSVHGILQARTWEWAASRSLLQGLLWTQELSLGLLHCGWILYHLSHQGSPFLCLRQRNHLAADGAFTKVIHCGQSFMPPCPRWFTGNESGAGGFEELRGV